MGYQLYCENLRMNKQDLDEERYPIQNLKEKSFTLEMESKAEHQLPNANLKCICVTLKIVTKKQHEGLLYFNIK